MAHNELSGVSTTEVGEQEQNATLMLVDDDGFNLGMLTRYLADYGFEVITAADGEACLEQLRDNKPDLVLMDIRMPRMDGITACISMKADPATRDIPVVFLSARHDTQSKVDGFAAGGVDYIDKPVAQSELIARVTAHLGQSRLYRSLLHRLDAYQYRFGPLDPEDSGLDQEAASVLSGRHLRRVYQACELLVVDMQNPPSLHDLARQVGTNAKRLSRDFQLLYSMTAFEWLREQRIQKAAKLLRDTDVALEKIALGVGYSSSANFCTAFRKRFNVSPNRYRNG